MHNHYFRVGIVPSSNYIFSISQHNTPQHVFFFTFVHFHFLLNLFNPRNSILFSSVTGNLLRLRLVLLLILLFVIIRRRRTSEQERLQLLLPHASKLHGVAALLPDFHKRELRREPVNLHLKPELPIEPF